MTIGYGETCLRCHHAWDIHAAPEVPFGGAMPCSVEGCDCANLQTIVVLD